jgi:hypothetical protein
MRPVLAGLLTGERAILHSVEEKSGEPVQGRLVAMKDWFPDLLQRESIRPLSGLWRFSEKEEEAQQAKIVQPRSQ